MREKLRVVVADDERPARSVLMSMLATFDDVAVVGEAANGSDAVEVIERESPISRCSTCRCRRSTVSASFAC